MVTSSNGNIFRVTGHLCGEFTGHRWCGALMFSLICARINHWVNNREAGDLKRYRARYDVIVMSNALGWRHTGVKTTHSSSHSAVCLKLIHAKMKKPLSVWFSSPYLNKSLLRLLTGICLSVSRRFSVLLMSNIFFGVLSVKQSAVDWQVGYNIDGRCRKWIYYRPHLTNYEIKAPMYRLIGSHWVNERIQIQHDDI